MNNPGQGMISEDAAAKHGLGPDPQPANDLSSLLQQRPTESADAYATRMLPLQQRMKPLLEAYAQQIQKPADQLNSQDMAAFQSSPQFLQLIERFRPLLSM